MEVKETLSGWLRMFFSCKKLRVASKLLVVQHSYHLLAFVLKSCEIQKPKI